MSDLRPLAHLEEQLGETRWRILIDPVNTGKVKEFCDALVEVSFLTEMTIRGVTYEILSFLKEDEKSIKGDVMIVRAKEMGAHQGREERENIIDYQDDIPAAFLDVKVIFVFTDDRPSSGSEEVVSFVTSNGDFWTHGWRRISHPWSNCFRVLRRKSK